MAGPGQPIQQFTIVTDVDNTKTQPQIITERITKSGKPFCLS